MSKMTIARIRIGNRITIPPDVMRKKDLHVGDVVYFEIHGVIGRDILTETVTNTNTTSYAMTKAPVYMTSAGTVVP